MKQLRLQALTPDDQLIEIRQDEKVFVFGNAGANDFRLTSAPVRADEAIAREDFWLDGSETTSLFLVRATDKLRYELTHSVENREY